VLGCTVERGTYSRRVDRDQFSRVVWGWPSVLLAICLGVYAVVSAVTGHGDRALVLAAIAAFNGFLGAKVLLD
jgi:hypothetical protein